MKKLVFLLIASMVLTLGYATDGKVDDHEPKAAKIIGTQIYGMLAEHAIPDEIRGSKAEVRLAVDIGNYLRILSVETDNEAFEEFIRSSIDFQKLTKGTYEKDIVYRVPIEVKK